MKKYYRVAEIESENVIKIIAVKPNWHDNEQDAEDSINNLINTIGGVYTIIAVYDKEQ